MTDEKKHNEWNECGHPDILDKYPRPEVPYPERQTFVCTAKALAESRCKCCGSELDIIMGFNLISPCGVEATISCSSCRLMEWQKNQKGNHLIK